MVTAYLTTCEYAYLPDLGATDREFIRQHTERIRDLVELAARSMVEIGRHLAEVRERLPYGSFGVWLRAEFDWSERTAYNLIAVYERLGSANFAELDISASALYLLAAPNTPQPAIDEALAEAEVRPLSYTRTRAIVDSYRDTEARGRKPDVAREAMENLWACVHNIPQLAQLVYEDGIRTPAQKRRLAEIASRANEARAYYTGALQALGYKTT